MEFFALTVMDGGVLVQADFYANEQDAMQALTLNVQEHDDGQFKAGDVIDSTKTNFELGQVDLAVHHIKTDFQTKTPFFITIFCLNGVICGIQSSPNEIDISQFSDDNYDFYELTEVELL